MATADQRLHLQAIGRWLASHKSQIGYVQLRPMATAHLYEQHLQNAFNSHSQTTKVISPDCSEFVTMICRMAGFEDPNGFDYDGDGNTMTMYDHLPKFQDISRVHLGTIVVFGAPDQPLNNQHVGICIEEPGGQDPLLVMNGSTSGPIEIRLHDYMAAEPSQSPVTFLAVAGL